MERMAKGRSHRDLYETKDRLAEVRNCYLSLIEKFRERENIIIINGNQPVNVISEEIWQKTAGLF